jgi:hypothetical protein
MEPIDIYIHEKHPIREKISLAVINIIQQKGGRILTEGFTPRGWNIFALCPDRFIILMAPIAIRFGFTVERWVHPGEMDSDQLDDMILNVIPASIYDNTMED